MEALARLLVVVLLAPAAALAHPDHGDEEPICDPGPELSCPLPPPPAKTHGHSELHLARVLLERGLADQAAVRLAHAAEHDAEAAQLLAEALVALGDEKGAQLARARAARLDADADADAGRPVPAAGDPRP